MEKRINWLALATTITFLLLFIVAYTAAEILAKPSYTYRQVLKIGLAGMILIIYEVINIVILIDLKKKNVLNSLRFVFEATFLMLPFGFGFLAVYRLAQANISWIAVFGVYFVVVLLLFWINIKFLNKT